MKINKKFTKGMYFWLFLPYLIPVLGGLIVNYVYKKKNEDFAHFCLTSGIFNPLLLQYIFGYLLGLVFGLLFPVAEAAEWGYLAILAGPLLGIPISYIVVVKLLKRNKYRLFYPIYWFSLLGAIFSYYKEKDKTIREKFGWFIIPFFFVNIFVNGLISVLTETIYGPEETFPEYETIIIKKPIEYNTTFPEIERITIPIPIIELFENKTITIEGNSYYTYPIELQENQTVKFVINVTDKGVINTIMFNSTEYEKLTTEGGYVYYFTDTYTSGVRNADIWITVPYNDTYYFIISTMPIIEGQATYEYPVELILSVYLS